MSNDMSHHIKIYRNVFLGLLILTVFTVGASYIHFDKEWLGVALGLAIACAKGYLVASYFMHLNDEKRFIYLTLLITIACFLVLFLMPTLWHNNTLKSPGNIPIQNGEVYKNYDKSTKSGGKY